MHKPRNLEMGRFVVSLAKINNYLNLVLESKVDKKMIEEAKNKILLHIVSHR